MIRGCSSTGGHSRIRLDNKSRVNREIYARFREGLRVRLPGPTRHRDGFAVWSKRLEEGTYAVQVHITGTGDAFVFPTGEPNHGVSCLVPPPPK